MDARGRRHPAKLVSFVRKLGEHGYRTCEAQAALRKRGVDPMPARETIKRWLDPDYWEALRMSQRIGGMPGPQPRVKYTWQRKMERLRELRGLGLSCRGVALVMNHDYGLRLCGDTVRKITSRDYPDDVLKDLMKGGKLRRGRPPVASKKDGRHHQRQAGSPLQAGA